MPLCWRRRSSSTTIPRSPSRAMAPCTTRRRSTRSSRCAIMTMTDEEKAAGTRHRPARRKDHRPLRLDVPGGDAQPAWRAAQSARPSGGARIDPGDTRRGRLVGSVGRQRGTARHRRGAGERCARQSRQPGPAASVAQGRRPGPVLRRQDRAGHLGARGPSTATSTSASSSRTTRPPTCTSGTAATCTSHPMKSNR